MYDHLPILPCDRLNQHQRYSRPSKEKAEHHFHLSLGLVLDIISISPNPLPPLELALTLFESTCPYDISKTIKIRMKMKDVLFIAMLTRGPTGRDKKIITMQ